MDWKGYQLNMKIEVWTNWERNIFLSTEYCYQISRREGSPFGKKPVADAGKRPACPHFLILDQLRPEKAKSRPHPPPYLRVWIRQWHRWVNNWAAREMRHDNEEGGSEAKKKNSQLARAFFCWSLRQQIELESLLQPFIFSRIRYSNRYCCIKTL